MDYLKLKIIYYRGYKIEERPNKDWGWNLYRKLENFNRWVWIWTYGSLDEAKAVVDEHLDGN